MTSHAKIALGCDITYYCMGMSINGKPASGISQYEMRVV